MSNTTPVVADETGPETRLGSVDDYLKSNPDFPNAYGIPLLGIAVNNGEGKLKGGYPVIGVEILSVNPGGPAAVAGLRGRRSGLQAALTVGLVAGALFFPPAMFGVVVLQRSGIGESHELIIAVDGERTRDVIDFGKAIEKSEGGEVVYLTVIRAGLREQIRVELPQRL